MTTLYDTIKHVLTPDEILMMERAIDLINNIHIRPKIKTISQVNKGDFIVNKNGYTYRVERVNKRSIRCRVLCRRIKRLADRDTLIPDKKSCREKYTTFDMDYVSFVPHWIITKEEFNLLLKASLCTLRAVKRMTKVP